MKTEKNVDDQSYQRNVLDKSCGVVKAHKRSGLSEWLSLRSHWSNCDRRQPKSNNHKVDRFNGETRNKMGYKKV